jgi:hypothetical protein
LDDCDPRPNGYSAHGWPLLRLRPEAFCQFEEFNVDTSPAGRSYSGHYFEPPFDLFAGPPENAKMRRQIAELKPQNVAIGLSGEPVPPRMGIGAAVSRNSHRLRAAAASLKASRSALSIK